MREFQQGAIETLPLNIEFSLAALAHLFVQSRIRIRQGRQILIRYSERKLLLHHAPRYAVNFYNYASQRIAVIYEFLKCLLEMARIYDRINGEDGDYAFVIELNI